MIEEWSVSRQIFVSYAQDDEAFVRRLVDDLSQSGANVWLDIRNARPGRHWTRSIEQALGQSGMMIVVLSPSALDTEHVMIEWQAYLEAYRPVIPILAQDCNPPGPLRTRRPIDFTHERDYSRAFHQLVTRLLDLGTRIRRSDPVIWTMATTVNQYREERPAAVRSQPHLPESTRADPLAAELATSSLRRMVVGLRDMLRRGEI